MSVLITKKIILGSNSRYCVVGDEQLSDIKFPVFRSTGDIVKVFDKTFTYIGRKIRVVKRWGQRVSLSQIENVALLSNFIKCCSCIMDDNYGIVLFVVPINTEQDPKFIADIRSSIKININQAAVPDLIFYIDAIPLNSHGKINYASFEGVIKEKLDHLGSNTKLIEVSEENLELKFYELWIKYTNLVSQVGNESLDDKTCVSLHQQSSSTNNSFTPSSLTDVGFLKMGGNSIAAIQLVFELSEFVKVPNMFIGKLLRDCTFKECFQILFERSWESVNIEGLSFVGIIHANVNACKRATDETTENDSKPIVKKKQKLSNTFNDRIMSSKCRGKTLIYLHHNILNSSSINDIDLKIKWQYGFKKCVDASPVIVNYASGRKLVLVGSHSGEFAVLNLTDGEIVSLTQLPDRIESSALISECGKYYYIGCYDGKLYCIYVVSGKILWHFETSDMVKSTAALGGKSKIIFGSYDHNLYCISSKTGKEIWRFKGAAAFSAVPVVLEDEKVVASSLDGSCICLMIDNGVLLWSNKLTSPVFSSPAVYGNNVVFAEVSGTLNCYDTNTGNLNWQFSVDGNIFSSLVFSEVLNDKRIIFGCHDKSVYCLSITTTPKILWKTTFDSPIFSTPFAHNGIGLTVTCTTKGLVAIMSLNTGNILASINLTGEVFSSPVIEDNCVTVGTRDNHVYCLQLYNR